MRIRLAALLFALCVLPASTPRNVLFAQSTDTIAKHIVSRCVDDSAVAVAHVDLQQVNIADAAKGLARIAQPASSFVDLPAIEALAGQSQAIREARASDMFTPSFPRQARRRQPICTWPSRRAAGREIMTVAQQVKAKLSNPSGIFVLSTNRKSFAAVATIGNAVVAGSEMIVARLKKNLLALGRVGFRSALSASESAALALVLVPSSDQRKALEETLPELPQSMPGAARRRSSPRGLLWGAVSYSPQHETWDVVIQSQNPAAATALQREWRDLPRPDSLMLAWMKILFPRTHAPKFAYAAGRDE